MSRRSKPARRIPAPDPIYNSVDIAKFINRLMKRGKKSIAQRIFYSSMDKIQEKTKENPIDVFKKALTNATPLIEVKARRIGGSTYQVPVEVKPDRGQALGSCSCSVLPGRYRSSIRRTALVRRSRTTAHAETV